MPWPLTAALHRRWIARRVTHALGRLDDRMLTDCGIARCDIPHIAQTVATAR